MSAHVLLNLLNELGKGDKCEACLAFHRFLATNSIIQAHKCRFYYQRTLKLLKNLIFGVRIIIFCHI